MKYFTLAWLFSKLDNITHYRKFQTNQGVNAKLTNIFIGALLIFSIVPFLFSFTFLTEWPPAAYTDPSVWNLTKTGQKWDVYIGRTSKCGELDCHLTSKQDQALYSYSAVIPERKFLLPEYRSGDMIYYRTKLTFPEFITKQEGILVFHSIYVWARQYKVYINEKLVDEGAAQSITVPILSDDLKKGEIDLAIVVDPTGETYHGLEHNGDLVVGPKSVLTSLNYVSHDAERVWPLWGILPPLVLCFIFCLFYIANPKSKESAVFSIFLASIVVHRFLFSSYSKPMREFISNASDGNISSIEVGYIASLLTSVLLLNFVCHYFRLFKVMSIFVTLVGATLTVAVASAICYSDVISNGYIYMAAIWARFIVLITALALSFVTWSYLRARKINTYRTKASLMFFIMTLASSVLYVAVIFKINVLSLDIIGDRLYVSVLMFSLSYLTTLEFSHYLSQKDWLNLQFKSFVGENLAEELINNPKAMEPREVEVSVMFTDIRSFTSISEKLPAHNIVAVLNNYMERMIHVINDYGGLIDKFAGDSIMASWGIPIYGKNDALNAVRCAVAMRKTLDEFNEQASALGWPNLRIGTGLHFGTAVAGVIGSIERKEYTLIGDTINTASRIEGETKRWECDILLSEKIYSFVKDECIVIDCGMNEMRGRLSSVGLYQLIAVKDTSGHFVFNSNHLEETFGHIRQPLILTKGSVDSTQFVS